ncbi:MAG: uracil-DNA glycosylase [Sulfurospirillum sp.]|nr:MAG: uracil-DNA glycosylase [Sulfurospirillum sp.]
MQQLKLLKQLYQLKSFGYDYYDEPRFVEKVADAQNMQLPDNLDNLQKTALACHLCGLSKTRKHVVFGEGNPHAHIMFIGEGPGEMEDNTGRPFVGRAGQLLTKIIENVLEIPRNEVYIANIVKCRPPANRVPTPEEANTCKPYLLKQIEIVAPKVIVSLGATSYRYLTGELDTPISRVRGEVIDYGTYKLVPTFHPSYLLRNPSAKRDVFQDMLKVKAMI